MAESSELRVGGMSYRIFRLDGLQSRWDVARLPYTLRILLEIVLRIGAVAEDVLEQDPKRVREPGGGGVEPVEPVALVADP